MLLFRFEDVLLTALAQQPGNTSWTYEQLSVAVYGSSGKEINLAIRGDMLGDYPTVNIWKALFGLPLNDWENAYLGGERRFTEDNELAVFRESKRIVCQSYPWLAEDPVLLREVIASSLSFAFLVWRQSADSLFSLPEGQGEQTLYQYLCAQNLAA
jgi:hypothetical protein